MTKSKGIRQPWRPIVQRVSDGSTPEQSRAAFSAAYAIIFNSPAAKETIRAARAAQAVEQRAAEAAKGATG